MWVPKRSILGCGPKNFKAAQAPAKNKIPKPHRTSRVPGARVNFPRGPVTKSTIGRMNRESWTVLLLLRDMS